MYMICIYIYIYTHTATAPGIGRDGTDLAHPRGLVRKVTWGPQTKGP